MHFVSTNELLSILGFFPGSGVAERLLLDAGSASNVIYYRYFANGWQVVDADVAIIDSYLADILFYKNLSNSVKVPVYMDDTKRLDLMVRLF